ncbi:hypothetical protein [Microlunatus parietis]|uniref:Uncharacterized protein n=1 Tax=Microlunatus parietis TaxID=682979 RepID=A0A7Y9IB27_9ACTN|nr:hypothetical protein [Microlunatus parietis]NYE73554.1 hypothetical protein [Microlunatus parietis]
MSRSRRRTLLLSGCGLLTLLLIIVLVIMLRPRNDDPALQQADAFVRAGARGEVRGACFSVVNSGGRLNGCMDDLRADAAFRKLSELPDGVRVRRVQVEGAVGVVTAAELDPTPSFDVRLVLVVDPDPSGGWRVRELNGRAIAHE